MAQGTDEASTLLNRVKFLWETMSDDVKAFVRVKLIKDNTKEFGFNNGCTMFIRVSFRSATLQRLHISEFGKIANNNPQRATETKTGTLQALGRGNTGVIESTAEGKNDFKFMWDAAVLAKESGQMTWKDFYPEFLSWLDDPDCTEEVEQQEDKESRAYFTELERLTGRVVRQEQRNFWIAQRRELGGEVHQEYPGTPEEAFMAAKDGTYYSRSFNENCVRKGRVRAGLYDPNLPVDVYFDIGVKDYMSLGFVQYYDGIYRIIGEAINDGYDIEWYIDNEIIPRGWKIRRLVFPHDIAVRQAAGSQDRGQKARSREDIIKEYVRKGKLKGTAVVKIERSDVGSGIEAVRRIIPKMMIDPKCTYLIECFLNYSKEWDPKMRQWKKTPLHDEFSHGMDMVRLIAQGHKENEVNNAADTRRAKSSGFAV